VSAVFQESPEGQPPGWFTAALAVPAREGSVEVGGARVAYRAWGPAGAPGAVLVHGTAAHARWWDHIAPFLAADGLRVAALSMSGHGDSDWRDRYSIDRWSEEVMAVASAAGIAAPPFIIGHSLGGGVASYTAARYGDALAGIIVIDTAIHEGPPPPEMTTMEMGFGVGRTYPTREAILARFRLVPEQPVLPYVREHIAAWSVTLRDKGQGGEGHRDTGQWGWKFDQSLFAKMDSQAPPPAEPVRCRVALVRAQHGMMTAEMADRLRSRLGQPAPAIEIPAAGHHVLLDEPLSLVTALRAVLANWTAVDPAREG
jgi:pimeloyl-ACP methyl ester carboxylesterase